MMRASLPFLFTTLVISVFATPAALAQTYDLPLFADDLEPGERYFTRDHAVTTTQKFGYDISGQRLTGGKWTSLISGVTSDAHWKNPKNANYFIDGKPFYAMRDGTVIGCWRNAPQNPRPKRPEEDNSIALKDKGWIAQELKDGLIPGGGNHLWILHDDGTRALYAHAQAGEIPASICPKTKTKYDAPVDSSILDENGMNSEVGLLPAQRKRVKAGQFLGLVGNAGSSTNPHLHIHLEKKTTGGDWVAEPLRFKRGMSTPWNDGKADIDKWTSFSGKPITKGEVLFWPPTRLSREFARHQAGTDSFGRMFDHLSNSGFQPKIIDSYSVGGKVFLNHIWEPADGQWRAFSRQSQATHQTNLDKAKADGYAPVFIDSYLENGQVRYAAIYVKNKPGKWLLRSNLTTAQHDTLLDEAKADGLKPVAVSVVSTGGQRRYTALYRSENIGAWTLKSQVKESEYQGVVNAELAKGRLPVYLCGYMHDGDPYYSAIFSSKFGKNVRARHGLSSSDYQKEYTKAAKDGLVTQTVTAFDGAQSQHRYGAAWVKP